MLDTGRLLSERRNWRMGGGAVVMVLKSIREIDVPQEDGFCGKIAGPEHGVDEERSY